LKRKPLPLPNLFYGIDTPSGCALRARSTPRHQKALPAPVTTRIGVLHTPSQPPYPSHALPRPPTVILSDPRSPPLRSLTHQCSFGYVVPSKMAMLATSVSGAALAQRCPGRCLGSRRGVSSACTSSTTNLPRLARLRRGGGCVLGLAPRGLRGSAVSAVRAVVTRASAPVPEGDATVASAELASASSSLSERSSHRSLGLAMAMVASAVTPETLHPKPSVLNSRLYVLDPSP